MPYKTKEDRAKMYEKVKQRNKKYIEQYLLKHPCADCGFVDIRCLEFDHMNPSQKFKKISYLKGTHYSLQKIQEEIEKCEVRCANCHRIRHYKIGWSKFITF